MTIDFHTHIFPPRVKNNRDQYIDRDPLFNLLYSNPKTHLSNAEELIASMDVSEIDFSVVLNIAWSSSEICHETNDYILESITRYPERLAGFCMVVLDSPETALREIERCIKNGIKGVGEIRPDQAILGNTGLVKTVIQKIIENNLILLTHTSEPLGHFYSGKGNITPEALYPFITNYPGLKLVCAHWGGGLPFYSMMPEVKKTLENVYFDSAASPFLYNSQVYKEVLQLAGTDKVLFGSDYPLLAPKKLLSEIETLNLPNKVKNQILAGNAKKLLGIE